MKQWVVAAAIAVAWAGPAAGEQGRTSFNVGVTVPLRVALDVVEQPAVVELTAQDVSRGYKDVAVRYRVRHNDRNGYLLELSTLDRVAQWIEVRGLAEDIVLRDDAVAIRRPGADFDQDLALELHFVLDPSTVPGTTALPIRIAVTPL